MILTYSNVGSHKILVLATTVKTCKNFIAVSSKNVGVSNLVGNKCFC